MNCPSCTPSCWNLDPTHRRREYLIPNSKASHHSALENLQIVSIHLTFQKKHIWCLPEHGAKLLHWLYLTQCTRATGTFLHPDGFVLTHLQPMMPAQSVLLKKLQFVLGTLNQSKPSPSGKDTPLPPPTWPKGSWYCLRTLLLLLSAQNQAQMLNKSTKKMYVMGRAQPWRTEHLWDTTGSRIHLSSKEHD